VDTIMWVQDKCWRGIAAAVATGDPGAIHLRELGVIDEVRACLKWTIEHRSTLDRALRRQ
jgi:hypothetical protein